MGTSKTKDDFKDGELCNIIRACSASGVTRFRCGELEIDFLPVEKMLQEDPSHLPRPPVIELSKEDKELMEEMVDYQNLLEDPESYEQKIIDSHIKPVDGDWDEKP